MLIFDLKKKVAQVYVNVQIQEIYNFGILLCQRPLQKEQKLSKNSKYITVGFLIVFCFCHCSPFCTELRGFVKILIVTTEVN